MTEKICPRCGERPRVVLSTGFVKAYCKDCDREYNYAKRKEKKFRQYLVNYNKDKYQNDPEYRFKYRARQTTAEAIRKGILVRPHQCQRCGCSGPVQAHHHDYAKPLDVEWLCFDCHNMVHRNE